MDDVNATRDDVYNSNHFAHASDNLLQLVEWLQNGTKLLQSTFIRKHIGIYTISDMAYPMTRNLGNESQITNDFKSKTFLATWVLRL